MTNHLLIDEANYDAMLKGLPLEIRLVAQRNRDIERTVRAWWSDRIAAQGPKPPPPLEVLNIEDLEAHSVRRIYEQMKWSVR
jgi:hypothetical protein